MRARNKGFTIIEVVLVLAIAGLIFLMVFIALPNMQMAQRNTQRRNDYNSLSTQITNYSANNNGSTVADAQTTDFGNATKIKSTWFNSNGTDPDGNAYVTKIVYNANYTASTHKLARNGTDGPQAIVFIAKSTGTKGYDCSGTGGVPKRLDSDKKKFAIMGYIEAGGSNGDLVCLESHV